MLDFDFGCKITTIILPAQYPRIAKWQSGPIPISDYCRFEVTLRKIHLTPDADPLLIADEFFTELNAAMAMKALGMQPARPVGRDL